MLDRRSFIGAGFAFAAASTLKAQQCQVMPPGVTVCRAQVNMPQLFSAIHTQECPEWCWAACVSMIFNFYGHPVSQQQIVRQMFGNVVCLPAGFTRRIGEALSRSWVDANGDRFTSRVVAAFDPANDVFSMNNMTVIDELSTDHPMLYCNTAHAMINYVVDYIPTQMGPNARAVGVVDPWPSSPRLHALSAPEMLPSTQGGRMNFLATVRIDEDD
jgi:hypothetical protein